MSHRLVLRGFDSCGRTPLSAASLGLAVVETVPDQIVVLELQRGMRTYGFDYQITAARRGHERYEVVRPRIVAPRWTTDAPPAFRRADVNIIEQA